jgi:hypothetical protein
MIKFLALYFPRLTFSDNFLWVVSYFIRLSSSNFVGTFYFLRKLLTNKKFVFIKFFSSPKVSAHQILERDPLQLINQIEFRRTPILVLILTHMIAKLVKKNSKKLYSHLFGNASDGGRGSQMSIISNLKTSSVTPIHGNPRRDSIRNSDAGSCGLLDIRGLRNLDFLVEWIQSLFIRNFPPLYTLKLQDMLFSHDIFAMVPLIGAILLGYEKKILKVPTQMLNDHLLRPDEPYLPVFKDVEKKF